MAVAGEREGVVETLGRLSALLRASFDRRRPQQVTLAEEMDFVDEYLHIQSLTYGQRLTVHRSIDLETRTALVPTMLLQPLVENAILHGIAVRPGPGTVLITAHRSEHQLVLEVADSGNGFPEGEAYRSGVGLSATESRLNLMFGRAHSIEYGRSNLGGARVVVRIPFCSAPERDVTTSQIASGSTDLIAADSRAGHAR
jgi:two-component system, LytTR family, sensor kinase